MKISILISPLNFYLLQFLVLFLTLLICIWTFSLCQIGLFTASMTFYLASISGPSSYPQMIHISIAFYRIMQSSIITVQANFSYSLSSLHFKHKISTLPFSVPAKASCFQIKESNNNCFCFWKI